MSLEFENFELLIEPHDRGFRARVLHCPAGNFEANDFTFETLEQDLPKLLQELQRGARGSRGEARHLGVTPDALSVDVSGAVKRFGLNLFQTVFAGPIGDAWRLSLGQVGEKGLRIQLRLSDAPSLMEVPWEYLCDPKPPEPFLFNSNFRSLVRYLEVQDQVPSLAVTPPLTVLVMIASPEGVAPLDVEAEWTQLQTAFADTGNVKLERLPQATMQALQDRLGDPRRENVHVFHFIGHGRFNQARQGGSLLLEGNNRATHEVSAEQLGAQLQNHRSLRLVVLNSCEGARTSVQNPFAGMAQTLAAFNIPAVIAMQYAISDTVAIEFARNFYRYLGLGFPVDVALSQARCAIFSLETGDLEFGIPVLYMRSSDGKIFDLPDNKRLEDVAAPSAANPEPVAPLQTPDHLENPDNITDPNSPFYVERDADRQTLAAIARQGVTITIKGPGGLGISMLLRRVQAAARAAGKTVAYLDFESFASEDLNNTDRFFRQFCAMISAELDLLDKTEEYWAQNLPNGQRAKRYLGKYILKSLETPLVLAMDRVERIFEASFRTDFFGMLRTWHNERGLDPAWKRLDLILTTSTEPSHFIDNHYQSPFNVGETIELKDFNADQVADLNRRYGSPLTESQLPRLMDLLGGHPYMTSSALYLIASKTLTLEGFLACAASDDGPFKSMLRRRLEKLWRSPKATELKACLREIIEQQRCNDEILFSHLEGAGLVVSKTWPTVVPRYRIFQLYFQEHLRG